ncbi:hypothetical protein GMMP1_650012 [Candidatus Magnetomoraceae bacterium gMMP-1]
MKTLDQVMQNTFTPVEQSEIKKKAKDKVRTIHLENLFQVPAWERGKNKN